MKKILFTAAALSLLLFAGCQKNGVAPKQDSVGTKKSILDQSSLNKRKDTIMVGGQAAPSLNRRDTIMVSGR